MNNENSSTGNNLRRIYEELGIALYDTEGQLRSSFDIFYDLSQIWDTLDKNTQNYIATEQAGKLLPFQGELTGKPLEPYTLNHIRNSMVA